MKMGIFSDIEIADKAWMNCFLIFIVLFIFKIDLSSQELILKTKIFYLGEDSVYLKIYEKPGEIIAFVHLHENETTSLEAGLLSLKENGGKLVSLEHSFGKSKKRNVSFRYNKTTYEFDPNRIYSANDSILFSSIVVVKGRGKVDPVVINLVKDLASKIWHEIENFPLIIALHNNKNKPAEFKIRWLFWKKIEPESYNIATYIKKFNFSSEANKSCSDIYINPQINNSEFFIVTERRDFSRIYKQRFSVVLQNQSPVDDGSLSVYAAKKNLRYINAEAKQGNLVVQKAMLDLILNL